MYFKHKGGLYIYKLHQDKVKKFCSDNGFISLKSYLDFVLKLFFAFGLAFEIPIATILLVWTGATTVANLKRKRPYVVVGCFVLGMLLTPPDVISQILLALPMWLLYEFGILFSQLIVNRAANREQKASE